jgi:hypothetical protein
MPAGTVQPDRRRVNGRSIVAAGLYATVAFTAMAQVFGQTVQL